MGVFGPFFAIRNDYHIIGDECGSSMVCMQPWFTCSFGLHALYRLLYWVQFVNTQGRVQNFIKTACRAADCMGLLSPNPALYGSVRLMKKKVTIHNCQKYSGIFDSGSFSLLMKKKVII